MLAGSTLDEVASLKGLSSMTQQSADGKTINFFDRQSGQSITPNLVPKIVSAPRGYTPKCAYGNARGTLSQAPVIGDPG